MRFKEFFNLPLHKKLFLTYIFCWIGFFISFFFGKFIYYLSLKLFPPVKESVNIVAEIGTAKYSVVHSTVSSSLNNPYLSYALSYLLSNFLSCLIIVVVFALFGYLSRDEDEEKFFKYLSILYLFSVLNPITGIVGYKLPLSAIFYIIPHGLFEFFGFSIAIVLGLELAKTFYYKKSLKKIKILLLFLSLVFISLAALLEPIDWAIYNSNLSVIKGYSIVLSYLLGFKL
ncbi:hypothetical protein [Methanocaldococcus infernus]